MQWFCALKSDGLATRRYEQMLRVAVRTAQRNTSLVPNVLYDGHENELTRWMRSNGVNVIFCRTFLHEPLLAIAKMRADPNILNVGCGAFLRSEIPRIAAEIGITDEYVLYTDVDVMFMSEVSKVLSELRPKSFAVAPEFTIGDYEHMNSGVMLMNLVRLRQVDAAFRAFIEQNLEGFVDSSWDQDAYRRFFGRRTFLIKIFGTKWDCLAPELNWKPYWGMNPDAKIVHFHGPKPDHDGMEPVARWPLKFQRLVGANRDAYQRLRHEWAVSLRESS